MKQTVKGRRVQHLVSSVFFLMLFACTVMASLRPLLVYDVNHATSTHPLEAWENPWYNDSKPESLHTLLTNARSGKPYVSPKIRNLTSNQPQMVKIQAMNYTEHDSMEIATQTEGFLLTITNAHGDFPLSDIYKDQLIFGNTILLWNNNEGNMLPRCLLLTQKRFKSDLRLILQKATFSFPSDWVLLYPHRPYLHYVTNSTHRLLRFTTTASMKLRNVTIYLNTTSPHYQLTLKYWTSTLQKENGMEPIQTFEVDDAQGCVKEIELITSEESHITKMEIMFWFLYTRHQFADVLVIQESYNTTTTSPDEQTDTPTDTINTTSPDEHTDTPADTTTTSPDEQTDTPAGATATTTSPDEHTDNSACATAITTSPDVQTDTSAGATATTTSPDEHTDNSACATATTTSPDVQTDTSAGATATTTSPDEHTDNSAGIATSPDVSTDTSTGTTSHTSSPDLSTVYTSDVATTHNASCCNCSSIIWGNTTIQDILESENSSAIEELRKILNKLKAQLVVKKTDLTSYRLKKVSAADTRTSAAGIGWLGVVIIVGIVLVIVFLDITTLFIQKKKPNMVSDISC